MYVRKKIIKGIAYYYLVVARREGPKVKQKVIAYLGPHRTVRDTMSSVYNEVRILRSQEETLLKNAEELWSREQHTDDSRRGEAIVTYRDLNREAATFNARAQRQQARLEHLTTILEQHPYLDADDP